MNRKPWLISRSFLPVLGISALEIGTGTTAFYLPCPFKSLTGIDCPGCGFQRSVAALVEGDFIGSFQLYPPAIPILALFLFVGLKWVFKWDSRDRVAKVLGIVVGVIILGSYGLKLGNTFFC